MGLTTWLLRNYKATADEAECSHSLHPVKLNFMAVCPLSTQRYLKRVPVDESRISSNEMHHQGSTVAIRRNVRGAPVPAVLRVHHAPSRRYGDLLELHFSPEACRSRLCRCAVIERICSVEGGDGGRAGGLGGQLLR